MTDTVLQEKLAEISPADWENALPIGGFCAIEAVRVINRPYSQVVRCRVLGDRDSKMVFVKIYRNSQKKTTGEYVEKIRREYEITRFWYDLFSDSPHYRVVKPVLALPEKYIFVSEESLGENLFDMLHTRARFFPSTADLKILHAALRSVGKWLQYKDLQLPEEDGLYDLAHLQDYVQVRLDILLDDPVKRFPADYGRRIQAFLAENGPRLSNKQRRITITHSDFNPGNILISEEQVTVLDFGRKVTESYLLDISKLYFQMFLLTFKPQYRSSVIKSLQNALLEGYGHAGSERDLMFRMLLLRHVVTHLTNIIRYRNKGWKERIYNAHVIRRELALLDVLLSTSTGDN